MAGRVDQEDNHTERVAIFVYFRQTVSTRDLCLFGRDLLGQRFGDGLFPDKAIVSFTDRRHLFGRWVTLEGLVRGLNRQLLFFFLYVGIAIENNSGTTFFSWEDGDALVSFEGGHSPSLQVGYTG